MNDNPESGDKPLLGVLLITGAVFLLALADALVKYFSARMSLWQLFVLVALVSLPTLAGLILAQSKAQALQVISWVWVATRSVLLLLMWVAYYAALPLIPLSVAAVAIYTTPLFIVLIASWGGAEQLTNRNLGGVIVGFLGVIVVLQPGGDAFVPAMLLPVLSALLYALAMVLTRQRCQKEHPLILTFGLNLAFLSAGSICGLVVLLFDTEKLAEQAPFLFSAWQAVDIQEACFVVAYGWMLIAVNTATARAYQIAPSALIGTFDYAYLIFACLWGYLLFHELPGATAWVGIGLIAIAGAVVLKR